MSIFAIGDLHLSVAAKKPMDIFEGWDDHAEKIIKHWNKKIKPSDTVVLAGDTSWGMDLAQAMPDFRWIDRLPGKKILLKGNHDYWWASMSKMTGALEENGIRTLSILHNNSFFVEGVHICGSRGWIFENGQQHDEKLIRREAMRIEASLKARDPEQGETVVFLHYPPLYAQQRLNVFIDLLRDYGVRRCYYGHIHGAAQKHAIQGTVGGVEFTMISADYLGFCPARIK